ncbi:MAG: hypothetical protein IT463_13445 [Planctomycetes bacterium]|nr:hypothetical protein [Planctomycetota bacterium]
MTRIIAAMLTVLLGTALAAQEEITGKEAPNFSATVCVNKPEAFTLEACKGEIILIKFWGPG